MTLGFALLVASVLATLGVAGVILKRNPLMVLISVELILNAANIVLVVSDRIHGRPDGSLFVVLLTAVMILEIGVAMSILATILRGETTADVDEFSSLSG